MDKISKLKGILSKMKVKKTAKFYDGISQFGNSNTFNYATNERYQREEPLKSPKLNTWRKLQQRDIENSTIRLPLNGFQDMILLTEQGKLWKYPIDNEQGMDAEKQVPFEDHVFFDHLLEDLPKDEYIQQFMEFITTGLAKNPWMTVDRKHEIIRFYIEYFNGKRQTYKEAGYDI